MICFERKGEAVAELGDGRIVKSKVLLKVLSVVGVAAEISVALFPVALADEPYVVARADVWSESFGRLEGGMNAPGWRGRAADVGTFSNWVASGFMGERSIMTMC